MFGLDEIQKIVGEALETAHQMFAEGKHKHACVVLEQLLKVNPENVDAMRLLGVTLHALGRNEESVRILELCLEKSRESPEVLNNLAISKAALGDFSSAIDLLEKAVELKPGSDLYLSNLGLQYRHKEHYERAIDYFTLANNICEKPTSLAMIGGCLGELKRMDEAINFTDRAIELNPQFAEAHVDKATMLHLGGKWKEGFREYEWRTKVYEQIKFWDKVYDPKLLWDGSSLENKTIIVHTEQGNGDTIQFCRFLPILHERCKKLIVHCSDVLAEVLAPFCDEVYTKDPMTIPSWESSHEDRCVPDHDCHCFMLSLPHLLDVQTISSKPYLGPYPPFDMTEYNGCFNIGIAWAGNPQHPNDKKRSCRLELFRELHDIPKVRLFSLMKDLRARSYTNGQHGIDLASGCDDMRIVDMSKHMTNYLDSAKIVSSMDRIVSVDTSIVHLAGALGKETLCLTSWSPDWRWGLSNEENIWYDSVKLLRQAKPYDWSKPFQMAAQIVKSRVNDFVSWMILT